MNLAEVMKRTGSLSKFQTSKLPKRHTEDPILRRREKFTEAINNQLTALECELNNKPYVHSGKRRIKETGAVVEREMRFRRWWVKDGNRYLIVLRYGVSVLFEDAIIAQSLDEVVSVLDALIDATKSGHLDTQFAAIKRAKSAKTKVDA